jgi:hypothetical protein
MIEEQEDMGASGKPDRAARQSPSPSVSALRASIPSAALAGPLGLILGGAVWGISGSKDAGVWAFAVTALLLAGPLLFCLFLLERRR